MTVNNEMEEIWREVIMA